MGLTVYVIKEGGYNTPPLGVVCDISQVRAYVESRYPHLRAEWGETDDRSEQPVTFTVIDPKPVVLPSAKDGRARSFFTGIQQRTTTIYAMEYEVH